MLIQCTLGRVAWSNSYHLGQPLGSSAVWIPARVSFLNFYKFWEGSYYFSLLSSNYLVIQSTITSNGTQSIKLGTLKHLRSDIIMEGFGLWRAPAVLAEWRIQRSLWGTKEVFCVKCEFVISSVVIENEYIKEITSEKWSNI